MTLCTDCEKRQAIEGGNLCPQCEKRAFAAARKVMKKILKVPNARGIARGGRFRF